MNSESEKNSDFNADELLFSAIFIIWKEIFFLPRFLGLLANNTSFEDFEFFYDEIIAN